MKKYLVLFMAMFALASNLMAENYKGQWEVGAVYGGIGFEGSSLYDEDEIYGGQIGYNVSQHWTVQAGVLGGDVDLQVPSANRKPINSESPTSEVDVLIPALELHYNFGSSRFRPYVAAGGANFHTNPDSNSKTYGVSGKKRDEFVAQYGLGFKWMFTRLLSARVDLRHLINTEYNYRRFGIPENMGTATAGLSLLFGGNGEMPMKKEPVKVAEAPKAPVDSDGDGVVDANDACPGTPAGTKVDTRGCPVPVDSDGDGVVDEKDECPGTPAGTAVDTTGCPQTVKAIDDNWVLSGVNFETNSEKIKADSFGVLDGAAEILKARSRVRVEIQGHTDSIGDDAVNQALSERRAASVKTYLIGKGVSGDQLETKGFGETAPIGDNKTKDGRAKNRRIEFKVLSR